MASQNGHLEVVEKLLEHGAKVDLLIKVCVSHTFQLRITFWLKNWIFFYVLLMCLIIDWVESTDGSFSEWTCKDCGKVIRLWS